MTRIAPLGGALAAAVLLAGCSVGGEEGQTRTVTVQQPAPSGGEAPTRTQPAPGGDSGQPAALAEATTTIDEVPSRFVVTEVKRSGPTVIVNARLEPTAEGESPVNGQVSDELSDGQSQELTGGATEDNDVFDGVAIVDPEGRKKYLVARDSEGRCLCTNQLGSEFLAQGAVNLEATLSAPPAEVRQVNLVVPGVKTFTDVPLGG